LNLANFLTALRIFLAPVSVLFLFWNVPHQELIAAGIFILAGLTDGLDGYAARLRKEITAFGKSFDPLADKILVISALISLAQLGQVEVWAVTVIIIREVLVTILRRVASKHGLSVGASGFGKVKTFFQITAIPALILKLPIYIGPISLGNLLLYIAVAFTVISGFHYCYLWREALYQKKDTKKEETRLKQVG
jgi:CDP-diacylglycerol--glycerol-3-phosphate 3-phosphatidyltransferase